jgi:ATP-binding cassette subfamily B protein
MNNVPHAKSIEVDLEYYESTQYYDTLHRVQTLMAYHCILSSLNDGDPNGF